MEGGIVFVFFREFVWARVCAQFCLWKTKGTLCCIKIETNSHQFLSVRGMTVKGKKRQPHAPFLQAEYLLPCLSAKYNSSIHETEDFKLLCSR